MKTRNTVIAAMSFALVLGLAACDKSGAASQMGSATSKSIAPIGVVAMDPGVSASAGFVKVAVSTAPAAAPNPGGEKVFKSVCFMCHQTGAGGAPILGNKTDWAPRIAKGKPTLYKHALEGFTGNNGMMPSRGGNPSLKDDEVKAAVDFMVSKIQ
ncbi:cytochrome c5 family protein [Paraburkholderia guartelaensis]|uniref:Cytochrome c5 family protein n=1 Tax=Paraburkholderia guartelaensis TaxID=2546446 RepID=A0A4R5L8S7_9BURK|nr:c-type cytochrome [Paraburkholderia guartelaensis]TDG04884.1 cytochrome c5 family protein [Paraburkholderia guartelaensis]